MISLEAYRAAVGAFAPRNRCHNIINNMYYRFARAVIILNMALLKMSLLLEDGDVESNPGPNGAVANNIDIKKYVQGSYDQGHPKYGYSAGMQCMSNAYFAICFSLLKKASTWKSFDLDYILDQGDRLFKLTGIKQYLAVDELPTNFDLEGCSIVAKMLFPHSAFFRSLICLLTTRI